MNVDNSSMKQQRASSPARFKDSPSKTKSTSAKSSAASKAGGKSSRSNSPVTVNAGKEKQAKGAAAVHASGAESPTLKRADKNRSIEDRSSSAEDPYGADESGVVVSDQPSSTKSSQAKGENGRADGGKQSAKSAVGCGPGFWREGCLQSELIQFHMNKSLKKESSMQAKASSSPVAEQQVTQEDITRQTEAVTQQNRELQEEIEKLEEENEYLKVGC